MVRFAQVGVTSCVELYTVAAGSGVHWFYCFHLFAQQAAYMVRGCFTYPLARMIDRSL